ERVQKVGGGIPRTPPVPRPAAPRPPRGGEGRGEGAVHGQGGRRSALSMSGGTREKRKQAEDHGSAQGGRSATHEGTLEHLGRSGKSEEASNTDNCALVCCRDRHD